MSKEKNRGNREAKKPKKEKPKTPATPTLGAKRAGTVIAGKTVR